MKKYNRYYLPSATEIKKAAAHLRKFDRNSPNYFVCEFYPSIGIFCYSEFIDCHQYTAHPEDYVTISKYTGTRWEMYTEQPEIIRDEIIRRFSESEV